MTKYVLGTLVKKFGSLRENLVEFRVENGPFPFITQCYIWALSKLSG